MGALMDLLGAGRARRRWRAAVAGDGAEARALGADARRVRGEAAALAAALERQEAERAAPVAMPPGADWAWRPDPWAVAMRPAGRAGIAGGTALLPGVTLFHDCPLAEIALRQERAAGARPGAPFQLTMDVLDFQGSFLSLALDLPAEGVAGLGPANVVQLAVDLRQERRAAVFARINVRHGPNTETLVRELDLDSGPGPAEAAFDLGLQEINPRRVDHAWLDLIFEDPAMSAVTLRDVTLARRFRADL